MCLEESIFRLQLHKGSDRPFVNQLTVQSSVCQVCILMQTYQRQTDWINNWPVVLPSPNGHQKSVFRCGQLPEITLKAFSQTIKNNTWWSSTNPFRWATQWKYSYMMRSAILRHRVTYEMPSNSTWWSPHASSDAEQPPPPKCLVNIVIPCISFCYCYAE